MNNLDVIGTRLGLGCARLGSVLGRDRADAIRLVQTAFDRGVRFFDTADIYGQGESERLLGAALGGKRQQTTIVTKAGQYFPAWMRAAQPFKGMMAPLIRRSGGGRRLVAKMRDAPLPQDFSSRYLRARIEASLRRLKTDHVDLMLLHSPPAHVIVDGEAVGHLDAIKTAGKAVAIGVSCEDVDTATAALDDLRIEAIELPLWPMTAHTDIFLDRAHRRGILVIGRGLMRAAGSASDGEQWRGALAAALTRGDIGRLLIGTTRVAHLAQVLEAIQKQGEPCS
ncbi:aldo/keto reductase [Bradyrhizobium sp. HKCCYLS2038]|uniref:aldo/keto reductase n=1 Tax=unclassified Bradyrhizobium TaxID=2631580 RepID=UPI003EC0DDE3